MSSKFTSDGLAKPVYGSTIICFVQPNSKQFEALVAIQNELKKSTFAGKLAFLPTQSFHMTISGLDKHEEYHKEKIEASDSKMIEAFSLGMKCHFQSVKMKPSLTPIYVGKTSIFIPLETVEKSEEKIIDNYREEVQEKVGRQLRYHQFHITLAYKFTELTEQDQNELKALQPKIDTMLKEQFGVWHTGKPILTFYKDMNAFVTLDQISSVRNLK